MLRDERFDTAFSLNVLEHVREDAMALRNMFELLQPGGTLILIVPAHRWLYGPMDSSIGHFRRYTKETMRKRMEEAGFKVERQKYIHMLGAFGWLLNGKLLRCKVPPRGQLRLLNGIVPACRRIESYGSAPFGVSLLTVARKGSDLC